MKFQALDLETTGLSFKKDKILGIGVGDTYYTKDFPKLEGAFSAHNFKFETNFLRTAGISVDLQFDTLLMASVLIDRPADLDLGTVANYYLGTESWKSDTDKLFKKKNWVEL